MATKYFPVGYGRIYDSSKNYTEQQLRDLATSPTGEYNEDTYNTIKGFEREKTGGPAASVGSINVVGQDSNPYQGSSGGKGSPSINIPTPNLDQDLAAPVNQALQDINVPTPNTEQLNLSPNLDQDLTKIDVGSPNLDQKINTPTLNTDQDLTKISVRGLQESAVEQAGDAQNSLITIGTDIQAGAVDIGKAGQEALVQAGKTGQEALVQAGKVTQEAAVQAGKAVQEQAVQTATQVSGGQKNETLEAVANNATKATENVISTATKGTELATSILTKGVETQVQQATTYVEDKVVPVVKDLYAIAYGDQNPQLKFAQAVVHDLEKNTKGLEALGNLDASLNASDDAYSSTTTPMADLDAKGYTGNEDPFGNIETATTKADKLTEEERLRRIRRLMLNRYGREDTILTGAKDPFNRRRYARSL